MRSSRMLRAAAVVLGGGMLLQVAGCGTVLAPVALGLLENLLLSFLFGGALGV